MYVEYNHSNTIAMRSLVSISVVIVEEETEHKYLVQLHTLESLMMLPVSMVSIIILDSTYVMST